MGVQYCTNSAERPVPDCGGREFRRGDWAVRRRASGVTYATDIRWMPVSTRAGTVDWRMTFVAAVLTCLVIGVADGDTLLARCETSVGSQNIKVRLAEIDAPEKGHPFSTRSKQHLADLCLRKAAMLRTQSLDRFGRTVARVECDGVDAVVSQVEEGFAWAYDDYVTDKALHALQHTARAAQRGLWIDSEPVAPWVWRRNARTARKITNT